MSYDLIPSKILGSLQIPSIWDDESWIPSANHQSGLSVSEDDNKVYIEASLPGMEAENIEVTFHEGYVWIRGEAKEEEKDKTRKYYRKATQSFSYRVAVPGDIDEKVEPTATYKNGVMHVAFNKSPKTQPKKIQVKVTSK